MGLGPGFFGLLNIFPLVCQQATSIQCVKYGNTYTWKSFCWHTGGGGGGGGIKYSGQGSFKVKKVTINKLLFLLKTIGIYPYQMSMILSSLKLLHICCFTLPFIKAQENLYKNVIENMFSFTFLCKFSCMRVWSGGGGGSGIHYSLKI